MTGTILNIEHFAVHDGPGIRAVVFLKGCPLRYLWCHTPESQRREFELLYNREHCLDCGSCQQLCSRLPVADPSEAELDIAANCPVRALTVAGMNMSAEQIIAEVEKDRIFFNESGGGLTISGGEPLFQAEFTLEIMHLAEQKGISCCVESCGYGNYKYLEQFCKYTDIFLYDIKATDGELHRRLTGVDNALILENLQKLNDSGAKIILRCPLIPRINDDEKHLQEIGRIAEKLSNVQAVHVEPYNPLAKSKYRQLNRADGGIPEDFPADETIRNYLTTIASYTSKPVELP